MRKLQVRMLANRVGGAPPVENPDPGGGGDGGGECWADLCQPHRTPSGSVLCCCVYHCPWGDRWVCGSNEFCT